MEPIFRDVFICESGGFDRFRMLLLYFGMFLFAAIGMNKFDFGGICCGVLLFAETVVLIVFGSCCVICLCFDLQKWGCFYLRKW